MQKMLQLGRLWLYPQMLGSAIALSASFSKKKTKKAKNVLPDMVLEVERILVQII
jgi:hypothetical protein